MQVGAVYRFDYRFSFVKRIKFKEAVEADFDRKFSTFGVAEWSIRFLEFSPMGFVVRFYVIFRASQGMQGYTVEELAKELSNVPGANPDFVQAFQYVSGPAPGSEPSPVPFPEEPKKAMPWESMWFVMGLLAALFMPSYTVKRRPMFKKVTVERRRPQLPFSVRRVK